MNRKLVRLHRKWDQLVSSSMTRKRTRSAHANQRRIVRDSHGTEISSVPANEVFLSFSDIYLTIVIITYKCILSKKDIFEYF